MGIENEHHEHHADFQGAPASDAHCIAWPGYALLDVSTQLLPGDAYVAPAAAGSTVLGADTVTDEVRWPAVTDCAGDGNN